MLCGWTSLWFLVISKNTREGASMKKTNLTYRYDASNLWLEFHKISGEDTGKKEFGGHMEDRKKKRAQAKSPEPLLSLGG